MTVYRMTPTDANSYFVDDTNGDDDNPGTFAEPWKSITKVNAEVLVPGRHVVLKRGSIFPGKIAPIYPGLDLNPIVFGAYGSGPRPIIDGSVETCSLYIASANYHNIRFENMDFSGGSLNTVSLYNVHDLYFYNCVVRDSGLDTSGCVIDNTGAAPYNITLDSCLFHDNYRSGLLASDLTNYNILVTNCTTHNNGHDVSAHHGMYVAGGVTLDNCVAYSNSSGGFKLNDNEIEGFNYPILKNSVSYSNYIGGILTHKNAIIHNNLIYGNTSRNMDIYGNTWGGYKIYFNTFVNSIGAAVRGIQFVLGLSPNSNIRNNIFIQDHDVVTKSIIDSPNTMAELVANYVFDYNVYYYENTNPTTAHIMYDGSNRDWTEWQAAGAEAHGHLVIATPQFVANYTDLHIADGGNLDLSHGVAITGYELDKDGHTRADPPNCGAYEEAA